MEMSSTKTWRGMGRGRGGNGKPQTLSRSPSPEAISRSRLPPPPEMEDVDTSPPISPPSPSLEIKEDESAPMNVKENEEIPQSKQYPTVGQEEHMVFELKGDGDDIRDSVAFFKQIKKDTYTPEYKGRGRGLLLCSGNFHIPDIPVEEENTGFEYLDGDKFTGNEDAEEFPVVKSERPVIFPTKFVVRDGRYFLANEGKGRIILSKMVDTHVNLLFMDDADVWYVRRKEDIESSSKKKEHRPPSKKSIERLLSDMDVHFGEDSYCWTDEIQYNPDVDRSGMHPVVGEVVIVQVARKDIIGDRGYVRKIEYQRAVVFGLRKHGARVQLLDDYGEGGISFKNIFAMPPEFTVIPPQMFTCELAGMEFFSHQKMVRKALKMCPLPHGSWAFRLEFTGNYSEGGRPLVNASVWPESDASMKRLDIKEFVLKNSYDVLSPYNYLLDNSSSCRVITGDQDANVWVIFEKDDELREMVFEELDKLRTSYIYFQQCCSLTIDNILTHEKENFEKVYVAFLPDKSADNIDRLCRVKLIDIVTVKHSTDDDGNIVETPATNTVCVESIDVGTKHIISTTELLPLSGLSPDLCYVPPLAMCVHLNNVKELQYKHDLTERILYQRDLRLALVYEWPNNVFPPEVTVYPTDEKEREKIQMDTENIHVTGLGLLLIKDKLAEPYTLLDREAAHSRMMAMLKKVKPKAKSSMMKDQDQDMLSCDQKFTGDLFLFDL